MPIYEYECQKCGKTSEVTQKITDRPLTKCTECGGKLQKLMSRSSFALKGTGYYTTDYKRKETSSGSDSAPACGATSGGCGKPECKD